jgi:hypothetical protein
MDAVGDIRVKQLGVFVEDLLPRRIVINKQELSCFGHISVHLVIVVDLGATFQMNTDGGIHDHQDNLTLSVRLENPFDDVSEITLRLRNRSLVRKVCIINRKLDQNRVGLLLDDALVQIGGSANR